MQSPDNCLSRRGPLHLWDCQRTIDLLSTPNFKTNSTSFSLLGFCRQHIPYSQLFFKAIYVVNQIWLIQNNKKHWYFPRDSHTVDALGSLMTPGVSGPPVMTISYFWHKKMHPLALYYTPLKWQLLIICWILLEAETLTQVLNLWLTVLSFSFCLGPWEQQPSKAIMGTEDSLLKWTWHLWDQDRPVPTRVVAYPVLSPLPDVTALEKDSLSLTPWILGEFPEINWVNGKGSSCTLDKTVAPSCVK